ncbi:uncharacterized protein LAESUDRAFT_812151 [Laetiporus sulphureus 93-53]|uniref:Uncharacterized protein n=1 Tax=Laetiporus sulphureus 93-53 TaxID=1314785 RepID=A0A165EQ49_9APHY|nr:uncharacterized protein LAESUDRAFT_812151 [Laetiporus sulphureus 93-53]KZT07533.1 hypothetical protein LAESUDRAFT_812151 [Laetiporus sulphureus 93-53]
MIEEEGKTESEVATAEATSATQTAGQLEDLTLQQAIITGVPVPMKGVDSFVDHPPALTECRDFFQGTSRTLDKVRMNFKDSLEVVDERRGLQFLNILRSLLQLDNAVPQVLAEALWTDPDQRHREHPWPARSNVDLNRLLDEGDIATFALNACRQLARPHGVLDLPFDNVDDYSRPSRFENFAAVKASASALLQENSNELVALRPKPTTEEKVQDIAGWHRRVYAQLCKAAADGLREAFRKQLGPRFTYFIVAIDECTLLGATPMKSNDEIDRGSTERMSLIAMQRIMKAADEFHEEFWFVLLDTTSAVFDLVPPTGALAPSFRLDGKLRPLLPWGYFGFDQMVKGDIEQNGVPTLMAALTLNRLKMYGRPHWSTLSESSLIRHATRKLLNSDTFKPRDELSVLAVFAARIRVEIAEGPASSRLTINSVRSHMRLFVSIVDRHTVETCSPSEPILALAAAHTLNFSRDIYTEAIQTFINELVLKGLVQDRGSTGELVSRFLLTMTRDATTERYVVLSDSTPSTSMLATVKVTDFLTTMIGEDIKNADGFQTLENFGDNAHINLHILFSYPKSLRTSPPMIDGFIVVYCGNLNEPFDPMKLSYIAWKTMAKDEAASYELANTLTGPSVIHVRHKPGHIVILMDLAALTGFQVHFEFRLSHAEATVPSGGKRWGGYIEQEPKHFCLNTRGHDYAVLRLYDQTIRGNNAKESYLTPLFKRTLAGRDDQSGICVRQAIDGVCNLFDKESIGNVYQSGKIR